MNPIQISLVVVVVFILGFFLVEALSKRQASESEKPSDEILRSAALDILYASEGHVHISRLGGYSSEKYQAALDFVTRFRTLPIYQDREIRPWLEYWLEHIEYSVGEGQRRDNEKKRKEELIAKYLNSKTY